MPLQSYILKKSVFPSCTKPQLKIFFFQNTPYIITKSKTTLGVKHTLLIFIIKYLNYLSLSTINLQFTIYLCLSPLQTFLL